MIGFDIDYGAIIVFVLQQLLVACLPLGLGLAAIVKLVEVLGVVQRLGLVILGAMASVWVEMSDVPRLWSGVCWVLLGDLVCLSLYEERQRRASSIATKVQLWQLFVFISLMAVLLAGLRVVPVGQFSLRFHHLLGIAYGGYFAAVVSLLVFQLAEDHPFRLMLLFGLVPTLVFGLWGPFIYFFALAYFGMSCVCAALLVEYVKFLRGRATAAQARPSGRNSGGQIPRC